MRYQISSKKTKEVKTKILAIGDAHFHTNNFTETEEFLDKLKVYLSNNRFDFIVCMGDTLHTHEKVHTLAFNKCLEYFKILSDHAYTYILVGNHDYINNSQFLTSNHPFNACKQWPNIKIVDTVIAKKYNKELFVFCPYVPDGRFIEALNILENKKVNLAQSDILYEQKNVMLEKDWWLQAKCIFGHQLIDGAKMGAITALNVETWDLSYPQLISGHIHDRQTPQNNLYYTGSCRQIAFGESHSKTIAMIESRLEEKHIITEIDLKLVKKKIVYMDINDVEDFKVDPDTRIKLTLQGKLEDFKAYKKGNHYKKLLKQGVKINFKERKEKIIEGETNEEIKETNQPINTKFDSIILGLINNTPMIDLYNRLLAPEIVFED